MCTATTFAAGRTIDCRRCCAAEQPSPPQRHSGMPDSFDALLAAAANCATAGCPKVATRSASTPMAAHQRPTEAIPQKTDSSMYRRPAVRNEDDRRREQLRVHLFCSKHPDICHNVYRFCRKHPDICDKVLQEQELRRDDMRMMLSFWRRGYHLGNKANSMMGKEKMKEETRDLQAEIRGVLRGVLV